MEMLLAENIRRFRRERSLTQEQLAEVLGVTTGAVYKWEAKLSIPELDLIVEMADLFDTSVDALLGYEMKDNRLEATVDRLREYRRSKDRDAGLRFHRGRVPPGVDPREGHIRILKDGGLHAPPDISVTVDRKLH